LGFVRERGADFGGDAFGCESKPRLDFPEMAVLVYPPRDILYDASFVEATQLATRDLARQAKGLPPMLGGGG